ncbi:hypothetical protein BJ741DRAFT_442525 [Chytriomyces cf. hyalinus JEL632]|nr:hypothetical protein BJ741DRAFT_442525 [Chytriomyces cf. hyalinus JEL632]
MFSLKALLDPKSRATLPPAAEPFHPSATHSTATHNRNNQPTKPSTTTSSTGGPHRTPATNNPTDIYAENLTSEVAADLIPLPPIETAYPAIKIEYGSKNDAVRKLHVKNQALVTKKNKRARLQMEGRSKAPNQFILYRREQLRLNRDTYASMSMKEASRVIGLKWRNESQEVKLGYLDQAEGLRKRREIIHAKAAASSSREASAPTEASEE